MAVRFVAEAVIILLSFPFLSCSDNDGPVQGNVSSGAVQDAPPTGLTSSSSSSSSSSPPPTAANNLQGNRKASLPPNQDAPSPSGAQGTASPDDSAGAAIFDVTKYGAVADATTDNVEAFMRTWIAACHWDGKSKVIIPEGKFLIGQTIFQGPCNSPEAITVDIRGTLMAQPDLSEYPSPEWFLFDGVDQLIVKGGGTFNGQGVFAWKYNDCNQNSNCQILPTNLKFNNVNNSVLQDINSVNSKAFHFFLSNVNNFTAFNLRITAPANSPNTNGMHLSSSDKVNLSNFTIQTGDDCISVGQGNTNVNITHVYCGPGHGLSVGTLGKYPNEEDVKGIIWADCILNGTTNGAMIKTWPGSPPSQASNIVFRDIVMNGVGHPIIIDQKYSAHAATPSRVKISNVRFKRLTGTTTSKVAVSLLCSELEPCDGIKLQDISLSYINNVPDNSQDNSPFSSQCLHANVSYNGTQNPPPCTTSTSSA